MFKVLALLVALYTFHSAVTGRVYVKSGIWGRTVLRAESPKYFWSVIVIYAAVAVMLITVPV